MLVSPPQTLHLPMWPVPLTPAIGREADLATILAWLDDTDRRLITLTGPGGVGKSRMALAIAAKITPAMYPDGVGFVAMAAITDPGLVLPTIAHALAVPVDIDTGTSLASAIGFQRLLLILDNMEQVVDASTEVARLLSRCPNLTVLVTSRTLLRISGEHDYPVTPLGLVPPQVGLRMIDLLTSPACRLFLQLASGSGRVDPEFTDRDATTIATICQRLDGLPLAIELAAARTVALTPAALLARLDRRLAVLTGGARDLPDRQQTLRAAIAWSDDLLKPDERILFHRLGIFVGGFTFDAVEAVAVGRAEDATSPDVGVPEAHPGLVIPAAELLDGLQALLGHSLIQRAVDTDDEPRYAMLETVREFAVEQLAETNESDVLHERHAAYYQLLVRQARSGYYGPEQTRWLDAIEAEHDNIRAALSWYLEQGNAAASVDLAASLWRFWEVRGYLAEGQGWLERAIALPGTVEPAHRANAMNNLGNLLYRMSEFGRARELYQQSLTVYQQVGDTRDHADALNNIALVASAMGDYEQAHALHQESLALRRADGDPWRLSLGLHNAGENLVDAGEPLAARGVLDEALAIRRRAEDRRGLAYVEFNLGRVAAVLDEPAADSQLASSLQGFREAGEKIGIADALAAIARLRMAAHQHEDVPALLEEALQIRRDLCDRRGVAAVIELVAQLAAARGRPDRAARLLGAAEMERQTLGTPAALAYRETFDTLHNGLRAALTPDDWSLALADGRSAGIRGVTSEAREEVTLSGGAASRTHVAPPPARVGSAPMPILPSPLTAREIDVLKLVAQGLADREIADQLNIGQRTVSSHVTNILGKLSVPSRAAAAAHAVRLGIA